MLECQIILSCISSNLGQCLTPIYIGVLFSSSYDTIIIFLLLLFFSQLTTQKGVTKCFMLFHWPTRNSICASDSATGYMHISTETPSEMYQEKIRNRMSMIWSICECEVLTFLYLLFSYVIVSLIKEKVCDGIVLLMSVIKKMDTLGSFLCSVMQCTWIVLNNTF